MRSIRRFAAVCLATVVSYAWAATRLWAADPSVPAAISGATLGGRQFWADENFFHQRHIQRNVYTGHCRLLDGDSHRQASGTYKDCLATLDRIKARDRLPPMRGKAVLLLHGLGRSHAAMDKLALYLREQGGYEVFNVTYPSTRLEIGEYARALKNILDHLDGIEEINFVGHSMGNVVVRYYLGDQAAPLRPDPRLKRFVMLGPPNHQADLAVLLSDSSVFQLLAGTPGQQLGRDWNHLEQRLATPQCEFGIIAGGRKNGRGYNPLVPGDNDGIVSVASTRLAGARDFVVLPVLHTWLMNDANAQQYTLHFLQQGCFISPERRKPIAE
jgi:pimeloyl-ACP methyl ester carboxylesterase